MDASISFVPALVNSGLPMNRFCFEGFLPLKKGRQTLLKQLAVEERTVNIDCVEQKICSLPSGSIAATAACVSR